MASEIIAHMALRVFKSCTSDSKMDPIEANNLPVPSDVKDWRDDVTLLPDITWNDVTFYLTETPSIFTK